MTFHQLSIYNWFTFSSEHCKYETNLLFKKTCEGLEIEYQKLRHKEAIINNAILLWNYL